MVTEYMALGSLKKVLHDPLQLLEPYLGNTQKRLRGYAAYTRSARGEDMLRQLSSEGPLAN